MKDFRILSLRAATMALICTTVVAAAQEIDWYSIDGGGGLSSGADIQIIGVIGQFDTVRMQGGDISLSGGYLPLPPIDDVLFKDSFE